MAPRGRRRTALLWSIDLGDTILKLRQQYSRWGGGWGMGMLVWLLRHAGHTTSTSRRTHPGAPHPDREESPERPAGGVLAPVAGACSAPTQCNLLATTSRARRDLELWTFWTFSTCTSCLASCTSIPAPPSPPPWARQSPDRTDGKPTPHLQSWQDTTATWGLTSRSEDTAPRSSSGCRYTPLTPPLSHTS